MDGIQWVGKLQLWAKSSLHPDFVNKSFIGNSYACSFTIYYCLWLLLCYSGRVK